MAGIRIRRTTASATGCFARTISKRNPNAEAAGYRDWSAADEAALDYIATRIAPKFGVSVEVIAKRLRLEKHWPPG
jgi:hypothetical protein